MAWSQSDLDKIDAAIASGVKSVTFADGRQKMYQNVDQMLAARRVIEAQLQVAAQALSGVSRRVTPYFKSGL